MHLTAWLIGDDAEEHMVALTAAACGEVAAPTLREASISAAPAQLAAEAWRRFGRGRHPANLNFGDRISYACGLNHRNGCLSRAGT